MHAVSLDANLSYETIWAQSISTMVHVFWKELCPGLDCPSTLRMRTLHVFPSACFTVIGTEGVIAQKSGMVRRSWWQERKDPTA